jgi:transcriptional regulator with XRE-family HTH domain
MTPKALRSMRLALGISVSEFAKLCGITPEALQSWETGTQPIDMTSVNRCLENLGPRDSSSSKNRET